VRRWISLQQETKSLKPRPHGGGYPAKMIYIDESGIDHNGIKTSCWTKRGAKVIGERSGKRRMRTSVIAALNGDNINAPIRFTGTANTELFLYWLEHILLPTLIVGQAVIMDNCSIHKSPRVKESTESVVCKLIYLSPYSPDLNQLRITGLL
jgi:hypothetical protein